MRRLYKVSFTFNSKVNNVDDFTLDFTLTLPQTTYQEVKRLAYIEASNMQVPSTHEFIKSFDVQEECYATIND